MMERAMDTYEEEEADAWTRGIGTPHLHQYV